MNIMKLKGKVVEMGYTIPTLGEAIGVERSAMYRKMNNGEKITVGQALKIKKVLKLSDSEAIEIFLS